MSHSKNELKNFMNSVEGQVVIIRFINIKEFIDDFI